MKAKVVILVLIAMGILPIIFFASCSKKTNTPGADGSGYKVRPVKTSEIGLQAICPVTSNVFNIKKETMAIDYKGKTYFLCCPDCSTDFEKKLGIMVTHEGHDDMKAGTESKAAGAQKEISYWTCPMHPQVKDKEKGQCPVCNMDLVPVYKKEGDRITVGENTGKLLGLKSEPARYRQINKTVSLPARVAYDNDLYLAQQEYVLTFKNRQANSQNDILDAAKFRLTLLGYTESDIKILETLGQPDKSLLYPGDKAWIFADVYENDLEAVKPGKDIVALSDSYPSTRFHGKVMFVEPALNSETRSAKARIIIDNTGNLLKLEMFVNIEIKTSKGGALGVPKSAVINTGLRKVVYIDFGNGEYEPRDVATGFTGDDSIEIKQGLKSGDLVVTNGNFMLDSESQLRGNSNQSNANEGMEHKH
ncbi:MAG: efflux RND transporter periplasmic adaptor subunit [Elusimicrobia bacterium]|nr:efflux RND transporter periplasmic adaptor subunit [Candidatus Liberimonas magnetica]